MSFPQLSLMAARLSCAGVNDEIEKACRIEEAERSLRERFLGGGADESS